MVIVTAIHPIIFLVGLNLFPSTAFKLNHLYHYQHIKVSIINDNVSDKIEEVNCGSN